MISWAHSMKKERATSVYKFQSQSRVETRLAASCWQHVRYRG
jgi:hypothetical protein